MVNPFGERSDLIVHSREPFNAEPPSARLRERFITPNEAFYTRSHGPVPPLQEATHRLRVDGLVATTLDVTVGNLRSCFPERSVLAVLQCAGNRRAEMNRLSEVSGDPWQGGAIGNAVWTGVALHDVLRAAGVATGTGLHVAFAGCDACVIDGERFRYEASIPLGKALSPEVLLAWAMNGETLVPAHGFPLRVIVPGYAGVRSTKWLERITVQDAPSANHIQARDYKLVPAHVTKQTVDWERGMTINEMPVNAAICEPAPGARLAAGPTVIRGWAMASGRPVVRVDVSADGGESWGQATLASDDESPWSWTFWEAALDLAPGQRQLVARAWDAAGQTQPADIAQVWNFKGYLCAAWHRVAVTVR